MQVKVNNKSTYLLKGCLLALIITMIFLMISTLVLRFTSLSETKMPLINNVIMVLSLVVGSIYASRKIKDNGWLQGAAIGVLYYFIIILLNLLIVRNFGVFNIYMFSKLLISMLVGTIGGIIGVNLG